MTRRKAVVVISRSGRAVLRPYCRAVLRPYCHVIAQGSADVCRDAARLWNNDPPKRKPGRKPKPPAAPAPASIPETVTDAPMPPRVVKRPMKLIDYADGCELFNK